MNDHQAFLAAIVANPDDDLPRLIFADYLDEHGDAARAEFIRIQCELAKIMNPHVCGFNHGAAACWVCRLIDRERELLDMHGDDWFRRLLSCPETIPGGWDYGADDPKSERMPLLYARIICGFVSQITIEWSDFAANSQVILDNCPIRNAKDGLVRLTTRPLLSLPLESNNAFLRERFPDVRFELPTHPIPGIESLLSDYVRDRFDGYFREVTHGGRSVGRPD